MPLTFTTFQSLVLTTLFVFTSFGTAMSCDRTSILLDSIVNTGGNYEVHMTFCVGGGVIGANKGAGDFTDALYFFAWGPSGMNATGFAPNSITSDTTQCTYGGVPLGPLSGVPVFGDVDQALAYLPTGPCHFTCVNANGTCGSPHTDCKQISLTFDAIPDSILMLGAEGGGDLFGGCWPNSDLMINFTSLPVSWVNVEARQVSDAVEVRWSTGYEQNNDHFEILRSTDGVVWEEIGRVSSQGNTSGITDYVFLDRMPMPGMSNYWIVQIDKDGKTDGSKVVSVLVVPDDDLSWIEVSPNPSEEFVHVEFKAALDESMTLELLEPDGTVVDLQTVNVIAGHNDVEYRLGEFPSGLYLLRLRGGQGVLRRKLVRL